VTARPQAVNWVHLVHLPGAAMLGEPSLSSGQYKQVRGLSRGLAVLGALNRAPGGSASITALARACAMHRTTVKRLLETLRAEGFVRHSEHDGHYHLTFEVRRLSEGFDDEPWVSRVAGPRMRDAVPRLAWPCDLGTAEAGAMVVRESTHRWSLLSQHRQMVGERLPMLVTAMGRAYLAACGDTEREGLLAMLRSRDDAWSGLARDNAYVSRVLGETRERGYGHNDGEWIREPEFAAVAVPVRAGRRLIAAINLVFPKSAVRRDEIEARYVPELLRLARAIGRDSRPLLVAALSR
jgi:IclR family mhp operon transcriptional activator